MDDLQSGILRQEPGHTTTVYLLVTNKEAPHVGQ